MEREQLYMLAIVPSPEVSGKIARIRLEFAEAYDCKAALKPPVHITIYAPFKAFAETEELVKQKVGTWCRGRQPFEVALQGFDAFRRNGVLFISVTENTALKDLHRGVSSQMTRLLEPEIKTRQDFHPHITIGYRDIPQERFPDALKDYLPRKFSEVFRCEQLEFWRHNGKNWETIAVFPFTDSEQSIHQATLF